MKDLINFEQFASLDIRIGKIINCEVIEKSEKLLRLKVDFGEEGERTILAGLQKFFKPTDLIDKQFVFVINLEPRKMLGEESQGMLLAADGEVPIPLIPQSEAKTGSFIR